MPSVLKLLISLFTISSVFIQAGPVQTIKSHKPRQLLITGWYYITDQPNNYKRQADKTNQVYYIDPSPIVTVKHFKRLELSDGVFMNKRYPVMIIHFDDIGAKAWCIATGKVLHNKLAFVIDNKLIITPTVNQQVNNGVTSVSGDNYSQQALKNMITGLNEEMK